MKKRIFIITNKLIGRGVETTLLYLLTNIDLSKYDITLGLICAGGELEHLVPSDIKITYLFKKDPASNRSRNTFIRLFWTFAPGWLLKRKYIKGKYDIAIAYSLEYAYLLKGFKGKKFAWVHGDWFPFKMRNHIIGRAEKRSTINTFKKFDNIICCSENLKKMLESFSNNKLENVIFLRNPINRYEIIKKSNEECDFKFEAGITYFVTVGRLTRQKGYDILIPIMIDLHKKYSNYKLIIIGDGEDRESLEKIVLDNLANEYIILLGYKANPFKYVKHCDVFVCSSRMEGYSTSISEAIILGKAVISTDCGGSDQLLDRGAAGILTETNQESLKNGIVKLLNDKELIDYYKKISELRSAQLFDTRTIIEDIEKVAFNANE